MMITGMLVNGVWWRIGDKVRVKGTDIVGTIADIDHVFHGSKRLPNRITVEDEDGESINDESDNYLTIDDLEFADILQKMARDFDEQRHTEVP